MGLSNFHDSEMWCAIPVTGFETDYQVSNLGRVKSLRRNARGQRNTILQDRILAGKTDGYGYQSVLLSSNYGKRDFLVHRLVAKSFVANTGELPEVNHIDGNKQNNRASNLEWVNHKQNIHHALSMGLIKSAGSLNTQFKGVIVATDTATGEQTTFCGKKQLIIAGFDHSAVYAVISGRAKTHKGYHFERISLDRREDIQC